MMGLAAAAVLSSAPAHAVVFDFSFDEFPELDFGGPMQDNSPANRIGLTQLSFGGVVFTLSAELDPFGTPEAREVTLFDYTVDAPNEDPDLQPLDFDDDPNIVSGTEDPNPLSPFGVNGIDEKSLVVQNPDSALNNEPNDLAPPSDTFTRLFFTLDSETPIELVRLTFVDDVDATVLRDTPTDDEESLGEIIINGPRDMDDITTENGIDCVGPPPEGETDPFDPAGTNTPGDNCVAGLLFANIVLNQGDTVIVQFDGSGAVLGFEVEIVPLPAALPLLLGGLGALGLVARRRRRAA